MTDAVLGIDVSKNTFDASLGAGTKVRSKSFNGWHQLIAWLGEHKIGRVHACLEATCILIRHRVWQKFEGKEHFVIIGYGRTSTIERVAGLEAQIRDLKAAGAEKLFSENVSSVAPRKRIPY